MLLLLLSLTPRSDCLRAEVLKSLPCLSRRFLWKLQFQILCGTKEQFTM